ncbi:MAG: alginate lyase family protein, partial [Gemmatimonadaceae bacterium]
PPTEVSAPGGLSRLGSASARARFETPDAWSQHLLGGRFFPGCDDLAASVAAADALDPTFRGWCLERAARGLAGRFDLLGHRDLAWGMPIEWHREPRSGVTAPRRHWSRIRYLDPDVVGDHKLLWELNRHQLLVTFAQAACLTGEGRWADACYAWLDDWMSENPPSVGVNWASSLEVAFRAIAWIWTLRLLNQPLPPGLAPRIAGHLHRAGRHLETYLSTWFSPNTHLTGEALGLLYLGTQLPQLRAAARWRDKAWAILLQQLPRHIQSDGVYFEQTTWYHRYTVDFYLHARLLAERNGLAVPADVRTRLTLALDHLAALTRPDGTMPLIGDDDGGKLVILDAWSPHHTHAPLAQGAVAFDRADYAAIASRPGAELAWMLGAEGVDRFRRLPRERPPWTSRNFAAGGYFVMRDGWEPESSVMVIDCGPHGVLNCGHAHADALALDLTVRGTPVFVDPGTATYTGSAEQRDRFRSSAAHNTVTIDGRSSSVMAGPFQWKQTARATAERWVSDPAYAFFQGSHDGYADLEAPATHRRSVLFAKAAGIWVVRDEILSEGTHDIVVTFQGAADISMELTSPDRILCSASNRPVLSVLLVSQEARLTVERGAVSPSYGVTVDAPLARVRTRTSGQGSIITVLGAFDGGELPGEPNAPVRTAIARLRSLRTAGLPQGMTALLDELEGRR